MKKFLLHTFAFSCIIALSLIGIECCMNYVPSSYNEKATYIEHHGDSLEVLILGSSHAYYGINPEIFNRKTYSLANSSQTIYYDNQLLEKYIERCKNLKTVIMSISMFSFYFDMGDDGDTFSLVNYKRNFGILQHPLNPEYYSYIISDPKTVWVKLKSHFIYKEKIVHMTPLGMYYYPNEKTHPNNSGIKRVKLHSYNSGPKEAIIADLYNMAELCQKHNVSLILVTTPTQKSYYSNFNPKQIAQIHHIIRNLTNKFDHVKYLDFTANAQFLDSSLYKDADHLNYLGATKFSQTLQDTLGI